ncbi:hypothetical protein ISS30_00100 [bacterium]|nr:hypothetical protein [FCB group bacterium]MBL7190070.1 hypothetical protein [bacterium]
MQGIQYLVDESGKRTAVQIDLKEWGEYWEDIYDILVYYSRKDEPEISWDEVKKKMET